MICLFKSWPSIGTDGAVHVSSRRDVHLDCAFGLTWFADVWRGREQCCKRPKSYHILYNAKRQPWLWNVDRHSFFGWRSLPAHSSRYQLPVHNYFCERPGTSRRSHGSYKYHSISQCCLRIQLCSFCQQNAVEFQSWSRRSWMAGSKTSAKYLLKSTESVY